MIEQLDMKDRRLLYCLDFDARMPLSRLAKKIGVSKQVAKYRIENLRKKNIIQGFYVDVNASKLGYAIYLVYLKFHHLPTEKEKEFIAQLSKQEGVGVNVSINGVWDHCIGIWAQSVVHFQKLYSEIMKEYDKYVKNKMVMIETSFYYFKPKQILNKKDESEIIMSGELEKDELDEKDRHILIALSKNARLPLTNLGKQIKLSPNSVKERLKKLEKNRVILGYRVMINYDLLGFLHYRTFLHLENMSAENEKKLIQFLKYDKSVISVTKTIGHSELEFRAVVKNIQEYYLLIEEIRENFPDILENYESIIYYKFYDVLNYFPFFT